MRTWKANKLARDTHSLERAEVGIGENMESKQANKEHSLPRDGENMESKQVSNRHSQTREGRGWDW